MGTSSITLVRARRAKEKDLTEISEVGGPTEGQYNYDYLAFIYHHYDGYVESGVGEWLANFICEFIHESTNSTIRWLHGGLFGAKLIKAFSSTNQFQAPRLISIKSLKKIFQDNYDYVYIITYDNDESVSNISDKSIMLGVYEHGDYILTARPGKFLEKYQYYKTQMEETRKSFVEIEYGDEEVKKEGYLSEDQL